MLNHLQESGPMYERLIEDIETRLKPKAAGTGPLSNDERLLAHACAAIYELRADLCSTTVKARLHRDERDGLKGELEDLKEDRADDAQTEHELRKTISELRAEKATLIDRLTARNNVINSLHTRIEQLEQSHKSINASLAARVDSNKDSAELREQCKQLKEDLNGRININIKLRRTNAELSEENERLKTEIDATDRLSAARHKIADEFNTELGRRSIELAAVTIERDRLRQEIDARAADTEVKCDVMNAVAADLANLEDVLANAREISRAIEPTCRALADQASRLHKTLSHKSKP